MSLASENLKYFSRVCVCAGVCVCVCVCVCVFFIQHDDEKSAHNGDLLS